MCSLSKDISSILTEYEKHKNNDWKDWLNFETLFDKPGKQGFVGLLNTNNDEKIVFKISQYINYLVQHENTVMKGLNELSLYCPHFCRSIGSIKCDVNPRTKKDGDPFDLSDTKYSIEKEALLCEYIEKSYKFYNYIKAVDKIHETVLYSAIKQVLLAISLAQRKKQFTHYDLHSFNIMMKKCDKDTVFLYVIDKDNQFCVPTYGHYPVIIDFGFSYINDMNDGPLWTSLAHTDVGFMSDRFDWVADPKLFLVTVSKEIKNKRNTHNARKLRRIVRNIFDPLTIDWDCGWDDVDDQGAANYVTALLTKESKVSELFKKYDHYCIDILQSLIILPLENQDYTNINKVYKAFMTEWLKIENEISSPFYNIFILKGIVDAARFVRAAYTYKDTRLEAVETFKKMVYERLDKVAKFCRPKKLHYERLLCSLFVLAKNIEGVLYKVITNRMNEKEQEYDKMLLKSTEQIYAAIDTNLPDDYVYNKNTTVVIFDSIKQTTTTHKLTREQSDHINETHPLGRGSTLYDLFEKNNL